MELPRSLAPWAAHLDLFPREVGLALGPLVRHVALAVGPLRSHALAGSGEPDGFDDLTNRGSYDRLLTSEWLLADELPDEFARRAAMGEHLFTRVARREPARSRMSLALFDAGPSQLGTPRIAHLAALVALARRAERAGARFAWGTIQRPDLPLSEAATPADVMRLLGMRRAVEAGQHDEILWTARIDEELDLDDVWIVGGARLGRLGWTGAFGRLAVHDVLEPGTRRLRVEVFSPSAAPREALLELPDDQLSTRLVRDPFDAARTARRKVEPRATPASNLFFDPRGAKLFARGRHDHEVIVYPVPNSPRAGAGRPRFYMSRSGPALAAGRVNRAILLASCADNAIRLSAHRDSSSAMPEGAYTKVSGEHPPAPTGDGKLAPILGHPDYDERARAACLVDGDRSLWVLSTDGGMAPIGGAAGRATRLASDVLALAHLGNQVVAVARPLVVADRAHLLMWPFENRTESLPFDAEPTRAFFGFGGTGATPLMGLLAFGVAPGRWGIFGAEDPRTIDVPADVRVAGVLATPDPDNLYSANALVTIEGGGHTLGLRGYGWHRTVHTFPEPLAWVVASPAAPHVGYATASGEVGVYSFTHRTFLCRYAVDGGAR